MVPRLCSASEAKTGLMARLGPVLSKEKRIEQREEQHDHHGLARRPKGPLWVRDKPSPQCRGMLCRWQRLFRRNVERPERREKEKGPSGGNGWPKGVQGYAPGWVFRGAKRSTFVLVAVRGGGGRRGNLLPAPRTKTRGEPPKPGGWLGELRNHSFASACSLNSREK
jgi:hypothetical protein